MQQLERAVEKAVGLPDEEVIARVVAGDRGLFEVLMRRHNQKAYRAVRSILRDPDEVDDALQQAWIAVFRNLEQFTGASRFSTWLVRIAVNQGLARLRRLPLSAVASGGGPDEGPEGTGPEEEVRSVEVDPERRAGGRELLALLEEEIDRLPGLLRTALVLREIEGMSVAETAEALGVSEQVVKTRVHRGRVALRRALLERAGEQAASLFAFGSRHCDRLVAVVLERIARL